MFIVMIVIGLCGSTTFAFIKKMDTTKPAKSAYYGRIKSHSVLRTETDTTEMEMETDNPAEIELEPVVDAVPTMQADAGEEAVTENGKENADLSGFKKFKQEMKDIVLLW
eukprot:CAMPEP_0201575752 /NCGR_PEP_ID=MMETSP0190_2-20130828/21149_1 /ASSEMBLY_ACC=CAM_ASM_000263 /TAXON_ID=37353 /ORGANISM="Rosalina sp." /LENGTH=109 /DNA_ID=CAMNT_0048005763 /DNA_START=203 /DNA_END=529 /DNA_ORIENTATION=+